MLPRKRKPILMMIFLAPFQMSVLTGCRFAEPGGASAPAEPRAESAGELKTHGLIDDHMVLQQGVKCPIWGWAAPGGAVSVTAECTTTLARDLAKTRADSQGRWRVDIGPFKAGDGPYRLTVQSGAARRIIEDVLVGEVWLASGQSNMAMMVRTPGTQYGRVIDADAEVAAANYPTIRMFTTRYVGRDKPLDDAAGMWADEPAWRVCTPQKADRYSAAAYFFARELHKALGVPVGIINSSVGMLGAACFTSREALLSEPELRYYVDEFDRKVASYPEDKARYERELEEWKAAAAQAEAEGKPKPPAPKGVADPRTSLFVTCNAYNGMIAPLAPYAVKGAIWYQGESDSIRPEQYRTLFPLMIRDWRRTWNNDDLFFLFVQLANADLTDWKPLVWDSWPRLREAQLMTLSVPKTGMAVAIDIGDPKDLHAPNKQDVGRRLALAAQGVVYGRDIVYSGPIYERMTVEGGRIRLFFKHLGSGLVAKTPGGDLRADAPLQTFTIAAAEGEFAPAQARIDGDTVVVWSDSVARPAAVRYAWSNDPVGCNLYNKAALPASPFRTSR